MPRMYDILRGRSSDDGSGEKIEAAKEEPKASYVKFPDVKSREEVIPAPEVKKKKAEEDHSAASKKLISAVRQHGVDNKEKAQEIYDSAVEAIKALLGKSAAGEDLSGYTDDIDGLLDSVFNQLVLGDNLLNSIYDEGDHDSYLPYHIVNVLVLSFVLGLSMGFNKSRLSHLGLASIFCDIGMDPAKDLSPQPKMMTPGEREAAEVHIARGISAARSAGFLNDTVKETIAAHHERVSGKGYPRGLGADDINPYAKILGLVDTYEAITHKRPYREGMNTHKAVRLLIGPMKDEFDTDVMKAFINKMSVYPIGSIVKLNTEETARVISVQPGSPLRPVVMVFRGPGGESVIENNIIDLSKQDFPSIKDPA